MIILNMMSVETLTVGVDVPQLRWRDEGEFRICYLSQDDGGLTRDQAINVFRWNGHDLICLDAQIEQRVSDVCEMDDLSARSTIGHQTAVDYLKTYPGSEVQVYWQQRSPFSGEIEFVTMLKTTG